jgi:hypothetical protein
MDTQLIWGAASVAVMSLGVILTVWFTIPGIVVLSVGGLGAIGWIFVPLLEKLFNSKQ